jgi:murein DD-endopeptidase MepM/ murein hydrolase activator NlpD
MRRFLLLAVFAVLLGACASAALTSTPPTPVLSTAEGPTAVATRCPDLSPTLTPNSCFPCARSKGTMEAQQATQAVAAPTLTLQAAWTATPTVGIGSPDHVQVDCGEEPACILDGHFLFQRPIGPDGKQSIERSYPYGSTQDGVREVHHGVEFYNAQGTPILAAADGKVIFAGSDKLTLLSWVTGYYGNVVVIEHHFPGIPETVYTLYAHQYGVLVTDGQNIKVGERIGLVGATGTATGSHLHFEVRLGNNDYKSNRNPELWLIPLPGNGTLAGRIEDSYGNLLKGTVNIQRVENGVPNSVPAAYVQTYDNGSQPINADDIYKENFVIGELPAGDYRLSLLANGGLYEQMIKIEAGKLTLVKFIVK